MKGLNALQVRLGKFQRAQHFDHNYFSSANNIKKVELYEAQNRILFASKTQDGVDLSKGNSLEATLGFGKTLEIPDINWSWKMKVKGTKPMTVLENKTTINVDAPGKNRTDIKVVFDMDLGTIGETWLAGSSDYSQVVRVIDKKQYGRGFLYTLKAYTDDPQTHYIKKKYLEPGWQWSRGYTTRGEQSETGSGIEKGGEIEFKNSLVKLRKEYQVTDYAASAVLEVMAVDNEGKKHAYWDDANMIDYMAEFNKEQIKYAFTSRLGDVYSDPDSGYPIKQGPGLEQQIRFGGNVRKYNGNLTHQMLIDFVERICYNKISPTQQPVIEVYTGLKGLGQFDNAVRNVVNKDNIRKDAGVYVTRNKSTFAVNSLGYGHTYTQYYLPFFGTIKVNYLPLFDDKNCYRELDPVTGFPKESFKMIFMDVSGGTSGEDINSNVRLVRKKGAFRNVTIQHMVGPGGITPANPVSSKEMYEKHIVDTIGVQCYDPSLMGMFELTV